MNGWEMVIHYYKSIGLKYSVNPFVYLGMHIAATPLFAAAVWWIVYNRRRRRSIGWPVFVAVFLFNSATIYLIAFGKHIPGWVYGVVGVTTAMSGYFTFRSVRKRAEKAASLTMSRISIIIPAFNEAANIGDLVGYLLAQGGNELAEVIVSDGGSADETIRIATDAGARAVLSPQKGRAAQMNYGAALAKGSILYFLHADGHPPASFVNDILAAIDDGFGFGRYRTQFDSQKWILKVNAFFTRFDLFVCYGGDQSLFMTKELFSSLEGFKESMMIMEDYEIVVRGKNKARYKIIPKDMLVSARKYDTNSWFRVQKANYTIVQLYKKGASQDEMVLKYKKLLNYR